MTKWVCRSCGHVWSAPYASQCAHCYSFLIMPSATESTITQRCLNEAQCLVRMADAMLERTSRPQSPTFQRAAKELLSINRSFERLGVNIEDAAILLDPVLRSLAEEEAYENQRPITPSAFGHRSIKQSEAVDDTVCPICYENFNSGEAVCELPCKHIFHDKCLREWLHEHSNCPVCRKVLKSASQTESEPPPLRQFLYMFG